MSDEPRNPGTGDPSEPVEVPTQVPVDPDTGESVGEPHPITTEPPEREDDDDDSTSR